LVHGSLGRQSADEVHRTALLQLAAMGGKLLIKAENSFEAKGSKDSDESI
jgi:hypothetical protein